MKKILTLGLWAAAIAACNNGSPDTRSADSAVKAAADTIKASTDTIIRKMDSGIKAVADTATSKIRAAEDSLKKKVKN